MIQYIWNCKVRKGDSCAGFHINIIVYFVLCYIITEFKQRVPCFDVLTGSVYSRALSDEATYVSALAYIVTVV